jgi:hypothetical protein
MYSPATCLRGNIKNIYLMCSCQSSPSAVPPVAPKNEVGTHTAFASKKKSTPMTPAVTSSDTFELPEGTLQDRCLAFGKILGLDGPVSEDVLLAALEDSNYARNLLVSRASNDFLQMLLNNPPKQKNHAPKFSNAELISKASKALFKWGMAGFSTVSESQLAKREAACLVCPNLIEPTNTLQKVSASSEVRDETGYRTGNKICSSCGCVVKNKMRLTTDTCPVAGQEAPGINRWGEEFLPPKENA